jgi:tRNA pseudouridine55 synthase
MRLIDSITPLLLDSKLFYDPDRMRMPDNKKRKSNLTHMGLKIGQGGTLDPLADGVLGASCFSFSFRQPTGVLRCNSEDEVAAELLIHLPYHCVNERERGADTPSHGCQPRHQTPTTIPGVHEGALTISSEAHKSKLTSKEYESWGLLGAATTTYDSEGPVLSTHSFDGVTKEDIEKALDQFRGTIMQTPPMYVAPRPDSL